MGALSQTGSFFGMQLNHAQPQQSAATHEFSADDGYISHVQKIDALRPDDLGRNTELTVDDTFLI